MAWWKGEDSWDDCPDFNGMSAHAVALFFRDQSRMARQMTDGVLTTEDLAQALTVLADPDVFPPSVKAAWRELHSHGLDSIEDAERYLERIAVEEVQDLFEQPETVDGRYLRAVGE